MTHWQAAWRWLVTDWQWPAAALFTGIGLLLLAPIWFASAGAVLGVVYLQLPVYMLHQWEEHRGDRFRQYFNTVLAGGREGLTPGATFWINAIGVWGVDLGALYLTAWRPEAGLIAIYLPLLNSLGHIVPAIKRREYNPGLITALTLFLPVGTWGWLTLVNHLRPAWTSHAIGLGVAVALHAAIIVHVRLRLRGLTSRP